MRSFWQHFSVRLKAGLTEPFTLLVLLFSGLASLIYWPDLVDSSCAGGALWMGMSDLSETRIELQDEFGEGFGMFILLLWIFIWPMLSGNLMGGTAAGGKGEGFISRPLPPLPIGARSRMLAEVLVVWVFVLAVRLPYLFLGGFAHETFRFPGTYMGDVAFRTHFIQHTLVGAVIMLPTLLAWTGPAKTFHGYLARPFVFTLLLYAGMKLNWLATVSSCILFCLFLSLGVLLLVNRELTLPRLPDRSVPAKGSRYRMGQDPEIRLLKDQCLKPLPWTLSLLALQAVLVVVDQCVELPRFGFYMGSALVLGFLFSMVALRPVSSLIIAAGFRGGLGYKSGDFMAAWSVLPLPREKVIRGVYLHGLLTGILIYVLALGVSALNTWLETGTWAICHEDGSPAGRFAVPFLALVPCLAGGLTGAAVGNRVSTILGVGAGIAVLVAHLACLVNKAPLSLHFVILIGLAAVGGLPALRHLKRGFTQSEAPKEDELMERKR
jgi:hypothetical protein